MEKTVQSAQDILTSTEKFHITLGLERITKIMELLGNPQNNYKVIHIAGTNGKGSTSKIINDILIEHFSNKDVNVGFFTSPHIFSYPERIKINNVEISQNIFDRLIAQINDLAKENNIELSEFELICAAAFYYFYIKKAKFVVLETGLGGTFDATNIVNSIVSVITTIDFDHKERLGETIEKIAQNKAGIIKKNNLVVISKDNLGFSTVLKEAEEKNAQIVEVPEVKVEFKKDKNYAYFNNKEYEFNLLGNYQAQNLSLALAAVNSLKLKIADTTIKKALKKVKWDFRLEFDKKKNLLIDCAHNPSGVKALKEFLNENFKEEKKKIVFGCLKNKDYKTMLETLIDKDSVIYFFEFDYPNALKFDELDKELQNKVQKIDFKEIKNLLKSKDFKVFCGSIYMLGKIFKQI